MNDYEREKLCQQLEHARLLNDLRAREEQRREARESHEREKREERERHERERRELREREEFEAARERERQQKLEAERARRQGRNHINIFIILIELLLF